MKHRIAATAILGLFCLIGRFDSLLGSTLVVSYNRADPGDVEVLVTVLLANEVPCAGLELTLRYDNSLLELNRIEPAARLSTQSEVGYYEFTDGKVAIVSFDMMGATLPEDSSVIFNVYFNVRPEVSSDVAEVCISEVTAVTDNLQYDTVEVNNGAVLVGFGPGLTALSCAHDTTITLSENVSEGVLSGFEITNPSLESLSYTYTMTSTGPATLSDNGDPASLSGVTPLLSPGGSYVPPSPALIIPAIQEFAQQVVTYHVEVEQHPGTTDSCETIVSFDAGVAPYSQREPAVASDGTNYLVVWEDNRNGHSIYGARVSPSGVRLDVNGIPISPGTASSLHPRHPGVASDGTNYLVVWEQADSLSLTTSDIYGARVDTAGNVLDPEGIAISRAVHIDQNEPAVAFGGSSYLVVWEDNRSQYGYNDIYGARVDVSGVVQDTAGIPIAPSDYAHYSPQVAFGGTNYLIVWCAERPLGDSWIYDVLGTLVNQSGIVLPVSWIPISVGTNNHRHPSAAFDGANYLVVCQDDRGGGEDIYGIRVTTSGAVVDTVGIPISAAPDSQVVPQLAFDGTNYLVVWTDQRRGENDIYGALVSPDGVVFGPDSIPVSIAPNNQVAPDVAYCGTNYLVVWSDDRSGQPRNCSARVTPAGIVLDPSGFTGMLFASAHASSEHGYVSLSWQMGAEVLASSFRIERSETLEGNYTGLELLVVKDSQYSFSCVDRTAVAGRTYWYRIVLVGPSGEESYGPIEVHVDAVPVAYRAYQSYPNPFNPLCTIRYDIPLAGKVSLRVFDVNGSQVCTLVDGWREPGAYSEIWEGRTDEGTDLPSGVYFYRLEAGKFVATKKMVLLK
jgi:hypothetical protein